MFCSPRNHQPSPWGCRANVTPRRPVGRALAEGLVGIRRLPVSTAVAAALIGTFGVPVVAGTATAAGRATTVRGDFDGDGIEDLAAFYVYENHAEGGKL